MLLILIIVGLAQSLDINSVHNIDEIIEFATGSVTGTEEAAEELGSLEIDGKKNYAEIIDDYMINYPHDEDRDEDFSKLKDLVQKIDEAWEQFGKKDLDDDDKSQLADLPETVDELYDLFVGQSLLVFVANGSRPFVCEITMPEHLRLRRSFQAVALSELRALILGLKTGEDSQRALARTILHSEESILMFKLGLEETFDSFRVCDPPEHIRGETFEEFLGLFQGIVVNTGHTDAPSKKGKCPTTCGAINKYQINQCFEFQDGSTTVTHCHNKECNGKLFNCFATGGTVQVCELGESSDRRYPWVQSNYERWGNPSFHCDGTQRLIHNINGYFKKCPVCLCICADDEPSSTTIRAISMIPQFADIRNNMIVTGVRFQEKDELFHIQIEESKLGPHAEIVPGSSMWKELNSFKYDTRKDSYSMKKGRTKVDLFEDFDFKILNWNERAVNLDSVKAQRGELIVGVGLNYNNKDKALEIQIVSWPFDIKTGKLKDPVDLEDEKVEIEWITWKNTPFQSKNYKNKRIEIDMTNLDDPVKAPKNDPVSRPNNQIKVGTTGFKKDMAQHTIPYLDLQGVTFPEKKLPLRTIELQYRRAKDYGGFLSFKIIPYDLAYSLQDQMNQQSVDKYKADFDGELVYDIPIREE